MHQVNSGGPDARASTVDDPATRVVHGLALFRKARPPRVLGGLDEGGVGLPVL